MNHGATKDESFITVCKATHVHSLPFISQFNITSMCASSMMSHGIKWKREWQFLSISVQSINCADAYSQISPLELIEKIRNGEEHW